MRRALSGLLRRPRERGTIPVLAAIACGAALVGAGVGLLLVGILNLRSASDTTLRSDALLQRVTSVEVAVVNAETGLRGYVITSASIFLSPLRAAERELPKEAATLTNTAARQHDHAAGARDLSSAAQAYMATYVPRVVALARTDPAQARSYAVTVRGKQRVDAIRARAAALENALTAQESARQRAADATANDDITYAIVVLVVLVLLTLAFQGGFGRLLLSRQRALRRSRETARVLQTSLLPLAIPEIPGCELAIRFTPAGGGAGIVGGDFYDVFELHDPSHWAVVVGDVCGKGAEAAATTAVARWTLRSASLLTATPTDAIEHLNEVMRRRRQRHLFATIAYLLFEIRAHEARVTIVCAGHPPPIVIAAGQPPAPASASGDLVGIWPEVRLHTSEVVLRPGDLIVAYTDGATDFTADSVAPLERFISEADVTSASSLAAAIEARALAGRPSPRDDIAVVAIQYNGLARPEEVGGAGVLAADQPPPVADTATPPVAPRDGDWLASSR
jgi:CHASE3 domain sensor protein